MRYGWVTGAALAACVGLAGCEGANTIPVNTAPSAVSAADQAKFSAFLANGLRDPSSAQFRDWRGYSLSNGDQAICVELNGKNAYGAYAGFEPYYLRLRGGEVASVQAKTFATLACQGAATGQYQIAPAGTDFGF